MPRPAFQQRTIRLVGPLQRETAEAAVRNAPLDAEKPLEVIIREEKKRRTLDQNAAMWAGPLRALEEHAWIEGRRYSDVVWHEHAKEKFLPEEDDPNLREFVKEPETYRKWEMTPNGRRVLVGSTTHLTRFGFSQYLTELDAYCAELGVSTRRELRDVFA